MPSYLVGCSRFSAWNLCLAYTATSCVGPVAGDDKAQLVKLTAGSNFR